MHFPSNAICHKMQCVTENRRIILKLDKYTVTVSLDSNVLIVSYNSLVAMIVTVIDNLKTSYIIP